MLRRMTRLAIQNNPLPYVRSLARRRPECIELVVIHCTELPDLATAREFGERILYADSATGNSGHYYIERSGRVEEWVPPERVAHHVRGYNARSIGIELVNRGRYPHWLDSRHQQMTEPYPEEQLDSLRRLLLELMQDLPSLRWISSHATLDCGQVAASDNPELQVRRKQDPGPLFPWPALLHSLRLAYLEGDALSEFGSD